MSSFLALWPFGSGRPSAARQEPKYKTIHPAFATPPLRVLFTPLTYSFLNCDCQTVRKETCKFDARNIDATQSRLFAVVSSCFAIFGAGRHELLPKMKPEEF